MKKIFPVVLVVAGLLAGWYLYANKPASVAVGKLPAERGYLVFADLGVRIVRPDILTSIELRPSTLQSVGKTVRVTTLSTNPEKGCELGVFYKIPKDGVTDARTKWTEESLVAASVERDGIPPQVKIFSDSYLVFEPSQATCSNEEDKKTIEGAQRGALWTAVMTAEVITQDLEVEAYVKESITDLSPAKAVLGGTYYVTEVWAGSGQGVVSYEDGHVAHTADFTYVKNGSAITIDSFAIREN